MGEAILARLVNGAMFDPDSVMVAEPGAELREKLCETYGIECVSNGTEAKAPDTVILAVKPQVIRTVCEELSACQDFSPARVISIAAGITTDTLKPFFSDAAVVRVMPNAPLMVGAGMSAVCTAEDTPLSEGELAKELFSLMGRAILVDESLINATTAISGSGPAYFALFCEELTAAGVSIGLTEADARLLATQTLHGSARYLELTDTAPGELRAVVTSPNGTTQAALESFAEQGLA